MATVYRFGIIPLILTGIFALSTVCAIPNAEAEVYVPASGRTLYVSPSGSDASSDCSIPTPCRQIRRALTLVQAGDLISVADGSYLGFNIKDKHGTALAPIIIQASGFGADITVTTDRGVDNRDNIYIADSSYVILKGLRTARAPRAGMRISLSEHIIVSSSSFGNNNTWGIFTDFADDLILEDNEAFGSGTQHGIYISNSSQRPIIRRNHLFNNAASGVQINADASMGGKGITEGALIERNLIFGNGTKGAAGINLDGVHNSIIRNNVIYNNRGIGITAFREDGASGPSGNLVANNTIVQPSNGRVALQFANSSGKNTVRNNIVIHLGPRAGLELVENADLNYIDSNNNIVDRIGFPDGSLLTLAAVKASSAFRHVDPDSSSAAPSALFIDVAASNYDLLPSAPAVDRGVTLAQVVSDYAGHLRPSDLITDIGAYEQQSAPSRQATFSYPLLTLPEVKVGSEIYHAEFDYIPATSPPEFQLKAARLVTPGAGNSASNLENNVLVSPAVKIGPAAYRVKFTLIDPALYKFRLDTIALE